MNSSMEDNSQLLSPRFPEGLRVLLVDDDLVCLDNMTQMLEECRYQVTKFSRVDDALTQLRSKTNKFDIMITDVRISEHLLEDAVQMDMTVILMSASDEEDMDRIINGVARGAHYLVKPVTMRTVSSIWQHVFRKMKHLWKDLELNVLVDDDHQPKKSPETPDSNSKSSSTEKKTNQNDDDDNNKRVNVHEPPQLDERFTPPIKKARVVWSAELHQQFVAAVAKLGIDKAVPKKILEAMNVPELTRENVASHLQKYRLYLRRQETQVKPDSSTNQQTSYQLADKSSAIHEYNEKQKHVITQQNCQMNMNGGASSSSYFGGIQQFYMIQSGLEDLILSHGIASTSSTSVAASTVGTTARILGSSAIMNRIPRLSNEMTFPSLNHNLSTTTDTVASYCDPIYNTFPHVTSEFQNSVFDDYHHHENTIFPNFHIGEETVNSIGPVVDNPTSQFYREHPQWNQSYSAQKMQ